MCDITQMNCDSPIFVAIGIYDIGDGKGQKPLLLQSKDNGGDRSYIMPTDIPNDAIHVHLYATSCQASVCFGGADYNAGRRLQPLLVVSKDSGVSLTYQ